MDLFKRILGTKGKFYESGFKGIGTHPMLNFELVYKRGKDEEYSLRNLKEAPVNSRVDFVIEKSQESYWLNNMYKKIWKV